MKRVFIILAATALMTSCDYKSELTNTTHPNEGKVEVEVTIPTPEPDPETGESSDPDATTPDSYTVVLNGEEVEVGEDGSVELPDNLEPGEYTVYVYSNTDEMNIENNITETGEGTITSSKIVDAGIVESLTEDLYFGTQTITVLADEVIASEVVLSQVTRTIKFNLNLSEGDIDEIVGVKASMGGIAQQWECVSNSPSGDAATITPTFTQGESLTKAATNDYLTSSIKVLGTNGEDQNLNLELTFSNGNTQTITSDVSDQLAGSNSTKSTPITLTGSLKVNTTAGAAGTITDWVVSGNDYDFDANQPNE